MTRTSIAGASRRERGRLAAVGDDDGAVDVARGVADEEPDEGGDLHRLPDLLSEVRPTQPLAGPGYDKRSTASDLSGLIYHLGHESAVVIGTTAAPVSPTGGRSTGHRRWTRWCCWTSCRPGFVMREFDRDSASGMFHWFLQRQVDLAEELISANVEPYLRHFFGRVLDSAAVPSTSWMSPTTTVAPSRANVSAVARPIPPPAP